MSPVFYQMLLRANLCDLRGSEYGYQALCVCCGKQLESVWGADWVSLQPNGGCEIQIIGSWGSKKFDINPNFTVFKGVVCDECAGMMTKQMQMDPPT